MPPGPNWPRTSCALTRLGIACTACVLDRGRPLSLEQRGSRRSELIGQRCSSPVSAQPTSGPASLPAAGYPGSILRPPTALEREPAAASLLLREERPETSRRA